MNTSPGLQRCVLVFGSAPEAHRAVQELAALGWAVAWVPLQGVDAPPTDLPSLVTVYPGAEFIRLDGHAGAFAAFLRQGEKIERLSGAAILVAVGNVRHYPQEQYGIPLGPRVLTPSQVRRAYTSPSLDTLLAQRSAHFLILLDWRSETSREAAIEALQLARELRQRHAEITLFYRDLKVDGALLERLTREMRAGGIVFCRYDEIEVRVEERGVHLSAPDGLVQGDFLILPEAVKPHPTTVRLAALLKVRVGPDGYFQEVNVRHYRPGLSNRKGIYFAGRCHMDAELEAALADAAQVAASIDAFLRSLDAPPGEVAVVDRGRCTRCLTCVRTCPRAAVEVVEREGVTAAYVERASCWGCGMCVAHCPVQAISLEGQTLPSWLAASLQGGTPR